jgi:hypothetical protein
MQRIGIEEIPHMVERHKQDDKPTEPVDPRQPNIRPRRNARDPFDGLRCDLVHRLGQPAPHYAALPQHDNFRAHLDPVEKIDDVPVGHADAARRHGGADRVGLIRPMNAIHA